MPTRESFLHSPGCPQHYELKRGGSVELRNGCLYCGTSPIGNGDALAWLLANAELTEDQRHWLPYVLAVASVGGGSSVPKAVAKHGGLTQ